MPIVTAVVVSFALVTAVVDHRRRPGMSAASPSICCAMSSANINASAGSPSSGLLTVARRAPLSPLLPLLPKIGGQAKAALSGASLAVTPYNVLLSRSYCALCGNTKSCFVVVDLPDLMYYDAEVCQWRIPV